jgi:inositol-polyphosphate multikinase
MSHLKLPPYQRSQRKSYAGFTSTQKAATQSSASSFTSSFQLVVTAPISSMNNLSAMSASDKIPSGFLPMDHQVAGHTFQVGTDEIAMLKSVDDGSVLKPGGSPMCAAREIKFYEQLSASSDPSVQRLKEFTSEYRGVQTIPIGNKTIKFIKLRDLTFGMLEPCVIDLKIGRKTYDPLATEDKKKAEDSKYVNCKTTVGFCIPGFQTYQISSGNFKKFGKDFGKKLNENTVVDGKLEIAFA